MPAVTALVNSIIKENKIPSEWDYIVNCYKGKGDAMLRTKYRGLKLLDQVLKVTERIVEGIIRKQVNIEWQKGGDKETYLDAKRKAKKAVYLAKKEAHQAQFGSLQKKEECNHIFKMAKKLKTESADITGDKCVLDDYDNMTFDDHAKLEAWRSHHERLLNVEFPWDSDSLPDVPPTQAPPILITDTMVKKAIARMKTGKAAGHSGITAELLQAADDPIMPEVTALVNSIIKENKIPSEWNYIVNCYKGKGDAMLHTKYRGLKLLDQVLKVTERIVEGIIRKQVNIDNMQFKFRPGHGTTDAIFILRQMYEKHMTRGNELYFTFIDP